MKTFILAAVAATTLALGTFGANADSLSGQAERASDVLAVARTQAVPVAGHFAAATTSSTVSGQAERANDVWSVIKTQRPLI